MKAKLYLTLFACLLAISSLAASKTGLEIMQQEEAMYNSATESFTINMKLISGLDEQQGAKREIALQMWLQNQNNLQSSMIKIIGPANLRGMGVLTIQESADQTSQWLYLPELGRSRRIASSSKSDKFMGSDITFGDLEPEVLQRWNYRLLPDSAADTYLIEAIPVKPADIKDYGYSKRILWISKDNYFVTRIEYFDPEGQNSKIQYNQEIVKVDGFYRANKIVVKNLLAQHLTVLTFSERKINPEFPENFFSKRYLEK